MLQNVFADNCVAVVFLVAVIANLVLPKDIFVDGAEAEGAAEHYREAQAENDGCAEFDAAQPEETEAARNKFALKCMKARESDSQAGFI